MFAGRGSNSSMNRSKANIDRAVINEVVPVRRRLRLEPIVERSTTKETILVAGPVSCPIRERNLVHFHLGVILLTLNRARGIEDASDLGTDVILHDAFPRFVGFPVKQPPVLWWSLASLWSVTDRSMAMLEEPVCCHCSQWWRALKARFSSKVPNRLLEVEAV